MKKYFKPLMIFYFAIALLITGYLYINPPYVNNYKKISWQDAFEGKPKLLPTINYKPFKYSLLGFSVGALVIYAAYLLKKKQ